MTSCHICTATSSSINYVENTRALINPKTFVLRGNAMCYVYMKYVQHTNYKYSKVRVIAKANTCFMYK